MTVKRLYQVIGVAVSRNKIIEILSSEFPKFAEIIKNEEDEEEINVQIFEYDACINIESRCENIKFKNGLDMVLLMILKQMSHM